MDASSSLAPLHVRLQSLAVAAGDGLQQQEASQLHAACTALSAAAKGQHLPYSAQKELWKAVSTVWNLSIELSATTDLEVVDTLKQGACEICAVLSSKALFPEELLSAAEIRRSTGRRLIARGQLEAAEVVLAQGLEHSAALRDACIGSGSDSAASSATTAWGPQQEETAELLFGLLSERLRSALLLGQGHLAASLVEQARALVGEPRLPARVSAAFRLALVHILKMQGFMLLEAGKAEEASSLLMTSYETLSETDAEALGAGAAAQLREITCSTLTLLAYALVQTGAPERALQCVAAIQGLDGAHDSQFTAAFLGQQALLGMGRVAEAETELLRVINHEEATPEICAEALRAVLARGEAGLGLARQGLAISMERFPNDPSLAVNVVRMVLGGRADAISPEQEALVLELASDERLQEALLEEEASQPSLAPTMRALLFNHACARLTAEAYGSAAPFFAAGLPLCAGDGQRLECLRAGALCALAVGQHERALVCLDAADVLAPGQVASALLRLKVLLSARREGEAAQAVRGLLTCSDVEPDVLRVACCEAQAAGMPGAARAALTTLLEHLAANSDAAQSHPPGYEATIWQNLVALVAESPTAGQQHPGASPCAASPHAAGSSQNGDGVDEQVQEGVGEGGRLPVGLAGSTSEEAARVRARDLASTIDGAVCRMRTLSAPAFFEQPEEGNRHSQQQWFALTAWNAALAAARAGHVQPAAALLACAGDLLAAMPDPNAATLQRCRTAYVMAAAATADVLAAATEEQKELLLGLALRHLDSARAACVSWRAAVDAAGARPSAEDTKPDVFLLLLQFQLARYQDSTAGQLAAVSAARANQDFRAEHFMRMAAMLESKPSRGSVGGSNLSGGAAPLPASEEVVRAVHAAAYQRLTAQAPLNYALLAKTVRTLVELSSSEKERLDRLDEAASVLGASPPGAYPSLELRWLVSHAWNRGATHARFCRYEDAACFQRWAVAALRYVPQFAEEHQEGMERELARTLANLPAARVSVNARTGGGSESMELVA